MALASVGLYVPWQLMLLLLHFITQAMASPVAGGHHHSCAILDSGGLKCWGENTYGQLGLRDAVRRGHDIGTMAADLPTVSLGIGRTAKSLAAGREHTCAILDNGQLKCWGDDSRRRRSDRPPILTGQLGVGNASHHGDALGHMGESLPAVQLGTGQKATLVAAGEHHNCAVLDSGAIKCWGMNGQGQLGLETFINRGSYQEGMGDALPSVDLGSGRSAKMVTAGKDHTCALLDNGHLKCWGDSERGQVGLGDKRTRGNEPLTMGDNLPAVELGRNASAMYLGTCCGMHTCAIMNKGKVKCWGENDQGQLGLGDKNPRGYRGGQMGDALPFVDLGKGRTAKSVATGAEHTCALLDNGQVKCWGHNNHGQLGLGDTQNRAQAVDQMGDSLPAVDLGTGRTALFLAVGYYHNYALLDNGQFKSWGYNGQGQLGLGDLQDRGVAAGEMGNALSAVNLHTDKTSIKHSQAGRPSIEL